MRVSIEHQGRKYRTDLSKGIDLSSPMGYPQKELKAWGVPNVKKEPVVRGDWIGSVEKGSPVNFYNIHFNPHGNGTHTESFGHISVGQQSVNGLVAPYHYIAKLVRIDPVDVNGDQVITLKSLHQKVNKWNIEALIIQTGDYPLGYDFTGKNPTYFEPTLLEFLKEMGIRHFLTDLPSVDREEDGGALASHKAFWDIANYPRKNATITEMLHFPENIKEGLYLLNLQVAAFENDASPSRPVIYPLEELG